MKPLIIRIAEVSFIVNIDYHAVEGFVGALSEIISKVFDDIHNLDENDVVGDPRTAKVQSGGKYFEGIIEYFHQWIKDRG